MNFRFSIPTLSNTIIAFSTQGKAINCFDEGSTPAVTCSDIYGNAGGDWVGCIQGLLGVDCNISEDPFFCDRETLDFTIHEDSPCAPFSPPNAECNLIGAWPAVCGPPTATRETSWGRIKAAYR